ncbi:flagellar biosynthetic protein FliO [Kaistia granuli]|uniref:flagellar biosynthetic protein FliO n=1 Tax=Kaistia granuli TaxID=363259 RepID=UPI00036E9361|nr:flagellar biosynthetic protein FliO [Kaistia granuli]
MHDYLAPMFGDTGATIAQFVITLVVVLLAILLVFWLIRLFTNGRLGSGPQRGRQPRLAVLDALPLDPRRRLVLVRRDNVEHLILIGGPSDLVVEPGIQRVPQTRRLEPLRAEPVARSSQPTQNGRVMAAPEAPRQPQPSEPRRPEPAPIAEAQSYEAPAQPEPASRQLGEAEPAPEVASEPAANARYAQPEAEPAFEPAPQRPTPAPQRQAPEPRTGRGFPSFLSGNRPRHTPTTADVPPQPIPPPRPAPPTEPIEGRPIGQRPRPYDPRPLLGSQQTPVAPGAIAAVAPAPEQTSFAASDLDSPRAVPRRGAIPPAPPVESADPFAGLDDEAERLARFEPIFDVGPENTRSDDGDQFDAPHRSAAPAVEPPQPEDEPVAIAEDFIEEEPLPGEQAADAPSPVGDLEKEMARLLGEISGSRKS